jgi:GDPmannose 4,6-dehydratase
VSTAPSALITGITGQDGSFLAELLLEKGYTVTGMVRGAPEEPLGCSEHLRAHVQLVRGDLLETETLRAAIERVRPRELYHLAAPSFVPDSWQRPGVTMAAIAGSCAAILETVRTLKGSGEIDRDIRIFVPASGAIFGEAPESPQREDTPCRPTTPYAIAKLAAHQLVGVLRANDGLHASSGIVYNHESERRPEQFVTRRITRSAAAISLGLQHELTLGSLDAVRDWSFAGDVMKGAWLMLQQEQPDDYVLASGVPHTVAELAAAAFACVGLDADRYVQVDSTLVRAPERTASVGDPGKARERLGWRARVSFEQLVERMVQADLRSMQLAATSSQ